MKCGECGQPNRHCECDARQRRKATEDIEWCVSQARLKARSDPARAKALLRRILKIDEYEEHLAPLAQDPNDPELAADLLSIALAPLPEPEVALAVGWSHVDCHARMEKGILRADVLPLIEALHQDLLLNDAIQKLEAELKRRGVLSEEAAATSPMQAAADAVEQTEAAPHKPSPSEIASTFTQPAPAKPSEAAPTTGGDDVNRIEK